VAVEPFGHFRTERFVKAGMSLPPTTSTVAGQRRRRPRAGAMVGAGLLLLPVVEIAVAVQVGLRIGAGWTVLLLLIGCLAGATVLRRVGLTSVRRLATRGNDRPSPGVSVSGGPRPPAQTALVVLAGVLLLIPGFVTDLAGLFLLLPGVRPLLARKAEAALVRRFDALGVRIVQGQVIGESVPAGDHVDVQVVQVRDLEPPALPPRS
jgi:UPF0716 protein FxsA